MTIMNNQEDPTEKIRAFQAGLPGRGGAAGGGGRRVVSLSVPPSPPSPPNTGDLEHVPDPYTGPDEASVQMARDAMGEHMRKVGHYEVTKRFAEKTR